MVWDATQGDTELESAHVVTSVERLGRHQQSEPPQQSALLPVMPGARAPVPTGPAKRATSRLSYAQGVRIYILAARLLDAGLLATAAIVAWMLVGGVHLLPSSTFGALTWVIPVVVLWCGLLQLSGAYSVGRISDIVHDLRGVARASASLGAGVVIFAYAINWNLSRMLVGVTFGLGLLSLLISHFVVRRSLQRAHKDGLYLQRVVAVGSRHAVQDLTSVLGRSAWVGLEVVAACVPDDEAWEPIDSVGWVFPTSTLPEVVQDTGAEHVFLLQGAGESSRHVRRIAWSLEGTGTRLAVVPQLTDIAHGRIRPRPIVGLPLIELEQPQLTGPETVFKRMLDVVGSLAGLLILSPLIACVALLIKLEDRGPLFYRQVRVGTNGHEFDCYKLRSMRVDADDCLSALQDCNEASGVLFKVKDDPRVTRVGKFIRRHSIDELPQLLNVLKGEMSLVGPRPPLPHEVANYHADLTRRLKVRPGMTGLWQVSGRSELDAEESERLDLYYVDNWSIWHDLLILWQTLRVVLNGRGAY
jgi:exopolysaccharide biosynthesis polyprenyl glycosylphosphotransferase